MNRCDHCCDKLTSKSISRLHVDIQHLDWMRHRFCDANCQDAFYLEMDEQREREQLALRFFARCTLN